MFDPSFPQSMATPAASNSYQLGPTEDRWDWQTGSLCQGSNEMAFASSQNRRWEMEDEHILSLGLDRRSQFAVMCVLDGHGGARVARQAKATLVEMLSTLPIAEVSCKNL